jgi:hypothetical protein
LKKGEQMVYALCMSVKRNEVESESDPVIQSAGNRAGRVRVGRDFLRERERNILPLSDHSKRKDRLLCTPRHAKIL